MQKYGLVDLSEIKRKERKSQWASRYKDRLPQSTLEGQPYEEGQAGGSSVDIHSVDEGVRRHPNGELWRPEDEQYYNAPESSGGGGRWHYPANFDDAVVDRALLNIVVSVVFCLGAVAAGHAFASQLNGGLAAIAENVTEEEAG